MALLAAAACMMFWTGTSYATHANQLQLWLAVESLDWEEIRQARHQREENIRSERESIARHQREENIRSERESIARAQYWHDHCVRVEEGKQPASCAYWTCKKACTIASTVAKIQRDVSKTSFESSSHLSPSSSSQSPLPLPSPSSFQPESQSQSVPVNPVSNYQTRSTFLEPSPQPSCSAGILQSCVWHWRRCSGNPASPGKRYSSRDAPKPVVESIRPLPISSSYVAWGLVSGLGARSENTVLLTGNWTSLVPRSIEASYFFSFLYASD